MKSKTSCHIKFLLAILCLIFLNSNLHCQENDTIKKDFLEINLSLWNFDFGYLNSKSSGDLPEESKFILDDLSGFLFGFSPEIQIVFNEGIGVIFGFEFFGSIMDESAIRKDFPSYFSEQSATFKDNDYEKNIFPIHQSNSFVGPKLGVSYQFNVGKVKIIPFVISSKNKANDFTKLEIDLKNNQNNSITSRKYYFDGNKSYGYSLGCEFRGTQRFGYVGIIPQFRLFRTFGSSYFEDLSPNGNILYKQANSFELISSTFSLAIKCGFQLSFKRK